MDKVTRLKVSTNHNLSEEKGEPKRVSNRGPSAYQPNALPLGHTGSLFVGSVLQGLYRTLIALTGFTIVRSFCFFGGGGRLRRRG